MAGYLLNQFNNIKNNSGIYKSANTNTPTFTKPDLTLKEMRPDPTFPSTTPEQTTSARDQWHADSVKLLDDMYKRQAQNQKDMWNQQAERQQRTNTQAQAAATRGAQQYGTLAGYNPEMTASLADSYMSGANRTMQQGNEQLNDLALKNQQDLADLDFQTRQQILGLTKNKLDDDDKSIREMMDFYGTINPDLQRLMTADYLSGKTPDINDPKYANFFNNGLPTAQTEADRSRAAKLDEWNRAYGNGGTNQNGQTFDQWYTQSLKNNFEESNRPDLDQPYAQAAADDANEVIQDPPSIAGKSISQIKAMYNDPTLSPRLKERATDFITSDTPKIYSSARNNAGDTSYNSVKNAQVNTVMNYNGVPVLILSSPQYSWDDSPGIGGYAVQEVKALDLSTGQEITISAKNYHATKHA